MHCEQHIDWTCDENGEPQDEIICGEPAVALWGSSELLCIHCLEDLIEEDVIAAGELHAVDWRIRSWLPSGRGSILRASSAS